MNTFDANSWSHFTSWQSVRAPSRPAPWQLNMIRRCLQDVSTSSAIAVLGATIEFRDLLAELHYKHVFVFERNQAFYNDISAYMKQEPSETLVPGNWLDTLPKCSGQYAVILSDLTSGNIAYENRHQFYRGISHALTPEGLFIDRILTKPCPFIPIQKLLQKYRNLEVNSITTNSFNCEVLFCSSLLENDQNLVDSTAFYDYLLSLNIPRISEFVQACYKITPRDCIWWYSRPWNAERKIYDTYFRRLQMYDEPKTSEYFGRCKLMFSHRKD